MMLVRPNGSVRHHHAAVRPSGLVRHHHAAVRPIGLVRHHHAAGTTQRFIEAPSCCSYDPAVQ